MTLDTVRITGWHDPLGADIALYCIRYGEQFWEQTPYATDRAEAESWAAWLGCYRAGTVEWCERPWAAKEAEMDALRRQWNADSDPAYVAADGNRYSDKAENDFYWQEGK